MGAELEMVRCSRNRSFTEFFPARGMWSVVAPPALIVLGLFGCALVSLFGCSGGEVRQCDLDSECASGFCRDDGTCAPVEPDGGVESPDADPLGPDAATDLCHPNHDGQIDRDEIFLAAGKQATFRVALDATVDTAGELQTGGNRIWDLSGELADDDQDVDVTLSSIQGSWYASTFPGATYATRLSQTEDLLGVFEVTETAVLLRGVVSPESGLYRTELSYDPPVPVLKLPLTTSSSWTTDTTINGVASGVATLYTENYESAVDAVGEMTTPFGTFPVLRVGVDMTRWVGAAMTSKRTYAFVSECYGTVATVVSQDYETETEFTDASEVRRLAP